MPTGDITYKAGLDVRKFVKGTKIIDNSLQKIEKGAFKAGSAIKSIKPPSRNMRDVSKNITGGFTNATKSVSGLAGAFSGLVPILGTVGASVAVLRIFREVREWFVGSTKAAREFGAEMRNIDTLMTDTPDKMGTFNEALLAMRTGIAPTQELSSMTSGLYDLISATGDTENALAGMEAIARASVGGYADMATTVNATAKVLNAYTIAVEDAEYATDLGLKTVERGMLTYGEYGRNISMVAGSAAVAKVPIEELHAAIATATKIQRPEAAFVGLRTAINKLTADKDKLREYGIEYDGLIGTIRQMKDADLSAEDWADIMPEERAAETLKALVINFEDLEENLVAMGDVAGTTGAKYDIAMDDMEAKTATFNAKLDEFAIKMGDSFNEVGEAFIDTLAEGEGLDDLLDSIRDTTEALVPLLKAGAEVTGSMVQGWAALGTLLSDTIRGQIEDTNALFKDTENTGWELVDLYGGNFAKALWDVASGARAVRDALAEAQEEADKINERINDSVAGVEKTKRILDLFAPTLSDIAEGSLTELDAAIALTEREIRLNEDLAYIMESHEITQKDINDILKKRLGYQEKIDKFMEVEKAAPKGGRGRAPVIPTVEAPTGTVYYDVETDIAEREKEKALALLGGFVEGQLIDWDVEVENLDTFLSTFYDKFIVAGEDVNILTPEAAHAAAVAYVDALAAEMELARKEKLAAAFRDIGKDAEKEVADAITAALLGQKDVGEMFGDILYKIVFDSISTALRDAFAASALGKGLGDILGSVFGGLLSFIPGFQHGTPPGGTVVKGSAEGTLVRLGENFTTEHLSVTPEGGAGGFGGADTGGIIDAIKRIQIINPTYLAFNDLDDVGVNTATKAEMGGQKLSEVEA